MTMSSSTNLLLIILGAQLIAVSTMDNSEVGIAVVIDHNDQGLLTSVKEVIENANNDVVWQFASTFIIIQCNKDIVIKEFQNITNKSNQTLHGLIYAGCLDLIDYVAYLSSFLNLPMITLQSNSHYYDSVYQVTPSVESLGLALVTVMKYSGWNKASIITKVDPAYTERYTILRTALHSNNINKEEYIFFPVKYDVSQEVFDVQSHLFILNADPISSIWTLCKAYSQGLYYPNYEWILLDFYPGQWWLEYEEYLDQINCSLSSVTTVLNRALVLLPYPVDIEHQNFTSEHIFNTSDYIQDAVTALTLALSTCHNDSSLSNQTCIKNSIKKLQFLGATGDVQFNDIGKRQSNTTLVLQYQDLVAILIGKVDITSFIPFKDTAVIWPDGIPPDGTPIKVIIGYQIGVVVASSILMAIALILIFVCFCFLIIYRNTKIVKLTSRNLNLILIFGATAITIGGLPVRTSSVLVSAIKCIIDQSASSWGYDICLGVALVKSFRVYYIFKTSSVKKKILSDWKLCLIVFGILAIDIIIFIPIFTYGWISESFGTSEDANFPSIKNNQGVLQNFCSVVCGSDLYFAVYIGLNLSYKFILHIIGLVLAFLTRNIEVDVLNDGKYTTAIILCSSFIFVIGGIFTITSVTINEFAVLWSIIVLAIVIVFMGFTFIPKMIALYRDPEGKYLFTTSVGQSMPSKHKTTADTKTNNTKIQTTGTAL